MGRPRCTGALKGKDKKICCGYHVSDVRRHSETSLSDVTNNDRGLRLLSRGWEAVYLRC
jgi:hypothetical protein